MKQTMTIILVLVMALILSTLAACSNSTAPSSSATTSSQSSENVREANEPSELIGTPDRIFIVKGENERTIEPGTTEFDEILELLRSRFPEKLKEAQRAITWADEAGFNRDMMREEFDFLELSYDKAQIVKLNCMNKDDYPLKEIIFEMMIIPLSETTGTVSIDTHKTSEFVGRSYGPLDMSTEIIAELLRYADLSAPNIDAEDYQGLTKEEYEDLQIQKANYEAMTDEEKQITREGGTISCGNFIHLWWEESIEIRFIRYVGDEVFGEWYKKRLNSGDCTDIYSFADEFGIDFETLKSMIKDNNIEEIYPLDRLETRYNHFHSFDNP